MKRFVVAVSISFSSVAFAFPTASAESQVEVELRPFTSQTNYMSLPGYLRHESYKQTGKWLPLSKFSDDFLLCYQGTRIRRSESALIIDIGSLGQMGDDEGENMGNISIIAQSIVLFPRITKFKVMWS